MGCLMCKGTLEISDKVVAPAAESINTTTSRNPKCSRPPLSSVHEILNVKRSANRPSKTQTKSGSKKLHPKRHRLRNGHRKRRQHGGMVPSVRYRDDSSAVGDTRRRGSTAFLPQDEPNNGFEWDNCQTALGLGETNLRIRPLPPLSDSTETDTLDCWQHTFLVDCIKYGEPRIVITTASSRSGSIDGTVQNPSIDAKEFGSQGSVSVKRPSVLRIERINGCLFLNQYLVMKHLGRGTCGEVVLCLHIHNLRLYAIKVIRKENLQARWHPGRKPRPIGSFQRGIAQLPSIEHENIVPVYEVIDDATANRLLIVMEYREGGPVMRQGSLEQCERLPESLASKYFRDMVRGLDYLHSQRMVHGRLKPENVLVSIDGTAKLSDFSWVRGMAKNSSHLMQPSDALAFCAPETLRPNTGYRGQPADIYALGACLYTLVIGRPPHKAPDFPRLLQAIQKERVRFPENIPISSKMRHLLKRLLTKNPEERMTLPEIRHHPWVTDEGKYPIPRCAYPLSGERQREASSDFDETIRELAAHSKHVRTYRKGDYIFREGDPGTFMLYIISGECEVLSSANLPPSPKRHRRHFANHSTDYEDSSVNSSSSESEFSLEMTSQDDKSRKRLMKASKEAYEFVKMQTRGDGKMLMAELEAGEIVGEIALLSEGGRRTATVRAIKKTVTKFISKEDVMTYLDHHPEARRHLRHLIWNRESRRVILEGVLRLGSLYETLLISDAPC